uniref:Aminotransferase-like plant mobile domain-containing protein n=1 Tax=Fagus sylvatica TaxID=28930 RepID=A0A2N9EV39_FAGSY
MVSSSRRSTRGRGRTFSGEGSPSVVGETAAPRGSRDNGDSSNSGSAAPESLEEVLVRPIIDPWYRSGERFPSVPVDPQSPPADWEWLVIREDATADVAWTPTFLEIRDLQIQRNEMLVVPLVFDFQCSRAAGWEVWIDSELANREFCYRLEQAGVLRSILISRCSNMFRDTEALRQLVRRWCPSTHTFFFAHGQLYTQLDLLHAKELIGVSCHIVSTAFNSSIVHMFLWEHALEYITKGRKPYENKFTSMPEEVAVHVGDFQGNVPTVYRWVGSKFYDHNLIPSLDSESKVCWRPYRVTHRGFSYDSVMSEFHNIKAKDYTLIARDSKKAIWIRPRGTNRHGIAAGEIPTINPFLKTRAFAYWSGIMGGETFPICCSHVSPLPHPRLFVATNTMTTYANRQSLGYAVWYQEESRWMIYGTHHPPLWLRDHPHIPAPGKVASNRGRRTTSVGTLAAKGKQSSKSKKREAPSKDSPAQASKKKKINATKGSREVLVLKTAVQNPSPAGESVAQRVSTPASKKPVRKTRAGKRTFVLPAFPSALTSIAARVTERKSTRGIVYSEKRQSKQRADTLSRVPIMIPDDLNSSSSSSSDRSDPSGAAAEGIRGEVVEVDAAEAVSDAENVAAEVNSTDESTASSTSSGGESVEAGTSTEEDEVSVDELEAAEASFDNSPVASASNPRSVERAVDDHTTPGVGHPSESGSHADPSLLDSNPSTSLFVRRARRGSIVSTDSEKTISATVRVPTPPSPIHESVGAAPTPIVIAAVVYVTATVQESETVPAAVEGIPGNEEVLVHIPNVPEEVATSKDPVQADVILDSRIPAREETFVQDPVDDISMEDMADTHDSYDAVLAETEDHVASTQAADLEVDAPVTADTSPTKTAESSNEAIAEEERRHQTAAAEFAIRGQPGLLSTARSTTLGSSVLVDMDAFFREFDRMSFFKSLWEKYGSCSSYFRLGVHVGNSMLTLLYCVLAHMEHTRLKDVTEIHILEWKAVVQEVIEGGFKFSFILDYLRRLAHDMFSGRILAELRVVEARAAALRDTLNMVAPNPWDLASARGVSAEPRAESALYGLLV